MSLSIAQQCWGLLGLSVIQAGGTFENVLAIEDQMHSQFFLIAVILMSWTIWKARNELIFNNNQFGIQECKSETLENWWTAMSNAPSTRRKGLRSLIILVCWEVWKERNSRVFEHTESTNFMVLQRIKDEARLWILAGAKHLSTFLQLLS